MFFGKTKMIIRIVFKIFLFLTIPSFADDYIVPDYPYDISASYINNDSNFDLVVGSHGEVTPDSISVLINDGYGNFDVSYIERENYHFLRCVNINNDDFPDIITRNEGQYVYWPNDGYGNFGESIIIEPTIGNHLKISDMNNDGDNDIIFYQSGFNSYWGILHNNGYGEFTENIYYNTEANTMSLNVGKINDDEYDDVLIATTDGPLIFYNNLPDFYEVVLDSFLCSHIYSFDMDNDGDNDVGLFRHVFTGGLSCKLKILYNSGNGIFTYADTLFFPSGTLFRDIQDYNNDSYPDIVYSLSPSGNPGESIYVSLNNQDGTFSEPVSYYIGNSIGGYKVSSADYDNNFYKDLAITSRFLHKVTILFNDSNGHFVESPQVGIDEQPVISIYLNYNLVNYPNPFNPETTITFSISRNSKEVELNIYNIKGELVRNLINNKVMNSGKHFIRWDGKNKEGKEVSSGLYLYRLRLGNQVITRKMLLLR